MEQLVSDTAILAAAGFIGGVIVGKILKKALKAAVTIGSIVAVAVFGANHLGLMNTEWAELQQEFMNFASTPDLPPIVTSVASIAPVSVGFAIGAAISFVHS